MRISFHSSPISLPFPFQFISLHLPTYSMYMYMQAYKYVHAMMKVIHLAFSFSLNVLPDAYNVISGPPLFLIKLLLSPFMCTYANLVESTFVRSIHSTRTNVQHIRPTELGPALSVFCSCYAPFEPIVLAVVAEFVHCSVLSDYCLLFRMCAACRHVH